MHPDKQLEAVNAAFKRQEATVLLALSLLISPVALVAVFGDAFPAPAPVLGTTLLALAWLKCSSVTQMPNPLFAGLGAALGLDFSVPLSGMAKLGADSETDRLLRKIATSPGLLAMRVYRARRALNDALKAEAQASLAAPNELVRRLRVLAGNNWNEYQNPQLEWRGILGLLGIVRMVRRAQAAMLAVVLILLSASSMKTLGLSAPLDVMLLALVHAGACLVVVSNAPYLTPAAPLREGLIALSHYRFNDLERFIAGQTTTLSTVNNRMLSDLCTQLVLDQGRRKANG